MFDRIIVPLDGSEHAENALPVAKQLALTYGADLLLVQAIQKEFYVVADPIGNIAFWPDISEDELRQHAEGYLNAVVNTHDLPATIYADVGEPAQVILDIAARNGKNLIVMSKREHMRVERWLYGSVTGRVMPFAPCPVLVVHAAAPPQHILLTLDGSGLAEAIIGPTIALARAFDVKVTFLHVEDADIHHDEDVEAQIAKSDKGLADAYRVEYYDKSHKYLRQIAARYPEVETETYVARGKPARRIIEIAEEIGCDLIAMSTHGRTGFARWRYGSVANKVLHHAPVGLLVSRPTEL